MPKMLITGSKGQLGNELRRCLDAMTSEIGPVPEAYAGARVDYVDIDELDIVDDAAVNRWFSERGPYDIVINCAAFTNVDACEKCEAEAFRVNAIGPFNLARACEACGAKFVHISTDYVFAGDDPSPRIEDSPARPVSAYGRTKWAGEVLAADACARTFIVRTAWLYGYVGRNFVKTMLRLARENGKISVVDDQVGNPTNANDLAHEILKLALTDEYGTYHCTNEGVCSWFDFASAIVDVAGVRCDKEPISSEEYKSRFPQSADRPAYSGLVNSRLAQTIGNEMRPWYDALASYMRNLEDFGGE